MAPSSWKIDNGLELKFILYKDIKNSSELIEKLRKGYFKCSFINPALIVDKFQVAAAAYAAILKQGRNKLSTNTIYTEIIYNLSSGRSITRALNTFGLKPNATTLLVVLMNDEKNEEYKKISECVDGEEINVDELCNITDTNLVQKEYDVSPTELEIGSLLDAVIGKMAVKEFL